MLKHSVLTREVPEVNPEIQTYLNNYKGPEIDTKYEQMKAKKEARRRKHSKKRKIKTERLDKLKREIADLTKDVKQKFDETEKYKKQFEEED